MTEKDHYPFTLYFRDRFNRSSVIRISRLERDRLGKAVTQNTLRRKQFTLEGGGVEFFRADNGLLIAQEFIITPPRVAPAHRSAIERLRHELHLFREATWLATRLNCVEIISRAPCNSGQHYAPLTVPVLFS